MRRPAASFVMATIICLALSMGVHAKKVAKKPAPTPRLDPTTKLVTDLPPDVKRQITAVPADTFLLAEYDFDDVFGTADPQGWIGVDLTAQDGYYFHIDDFVGLVGGLTPLEGSQSAWCGAQPDAGDPYLCGYATLPGYGNSWNQSWMFSCHAVSGDVRIDYLIRWDSEPGYDYTYVEYDTCDAVGTSWVNLKTYDNVGEGLGTAVVDSVAHGGDVRLRFHFVSDGAWSDDDGLWDTEGAVIIDSVTVTDGNNVIDFQDFETESPGDLATSDGDWTSEVEMPYGLYSGLFVGHTVLQEDPCVSNVTNLWAFFNGSTYDFACGGHPGQKVVPYENERGQYIHNEIWSPWIDWDTDIDGNPIPPTGDEWYHAFYEFDLYADLPLNPLVGQYWHVRSIIGGCPQSWQDRGFADFFYSKTWRHLSYGIGDLVDPGIEQLQLALMVMDLCGIWCGIYGTGECHTHAPLFDNVRATRIRYNGPQWRVRGLDLFQDNFSTDGTVTGSVRIDVAIDILPSSNPNILPGDSAVVNIFDGSGLATDTYTGVGPAAYAYIAVHPQNQPGKGGPALSDDTSRWPVVDSLVADGAMWYCIRLDTVFSASGYHQPDGFCVDLNDDLFTPGDTIFFYFSARNLAGGITYASVPVLGGVVLGSAAEARATAFEVTCLPANGLAPGTSILYVDDFDHRGAQPFFDTAFENMNINLDRYDVRDSHRNIDNGPGTRVSNVLTQVIPYYRTIIWNTGNLYSVALTDGVDYKSDDFGFLYSFMDNHSSLPGLYLSGDNLAVEWNGLTGASAVNFRNTFMDFTLINDDHQAVGHPVNPLAIGTTGSCFDHIPYPDTMVVFGGCPTINRFDVLDAPTTATVEMTYDGNAAHGAVLKQYTTNSMASQAGVFLSGFSYHYIRDDRPVGIIDRAEHLKDILNCLNQIVDDPIGTDDATAYRNWLAQNYPNPFNPTTAIRFSLREPGHVAVRIYNVRGQLVTTLVDGVKPAGQIHDVRWNGKNAAGQSVASGVYFYRITASDFVKTKKMVLLR